MKPRKPYRRATPTPEQRRLAELAVKPWTPAEPCGLCSTTPMAVGEACGWCGKVGASHGVFGRMGR